MRASCSHPVEAVERVGSQVLVVSVRASWGLRGARGARPRAASRQFSNVGSAPALDFFPELLKLGAEREHAPPLPPKIAHRPLAPAARIEARGVLLQKWLGKALLGVVLFSCPGAGSLQ
jgi:hypothetical protein